MYYFKFATTIVFIYFISLLSADQEKWDQFAYQNSPIVEMALKTRGQKFTDEMTQELSSVLRDFTQGNSILDASLYAYKFQAKEAAFPNIIVLQGLKESESHKDVVLLLKDTQDRPLVVMKWFINPYHFLSEISAMEKLQQLHLTQSDRVLPIAVGKASYNGSQFYLLVETVAKGEVITSLVNSLASNKTQESKEIAFKALKALAKALAEIHSIISWNSSLITNQPVWNEEEIAKQLNQLDNSLSIDDLVPIISEIKSNYYATEHSKHYRLGDPNLGNFLYDAPNERITIIDMNFMNFSLDPDGFPIDDATEDYSVVMMHLSILEYIFQLEDYQELIRSFDETYRAEIEFAGPTELELNYSTVNTWMELLYSQLTYAKMKPEESLPFLFTATLKLREIILAHVAV